MNRRGFLAGVMGLCAGLPFVGRFLPKPTVLKSWIVLDVVESGGEWLWVCTTKRLMSDGSIQMVLNFREPIKQGAPGAIRLTSNGSSSDWKCESFTLTKLASTQTDGVVIDWFRG